MTHRWHDLYHHQKTPAHHLDPRTKLLTGVSFVALIVLSRSLSLVQFVAYLLLLAVCVGLARLSWKALLKRVGVIFPFLLSFALSGAMGLLPANRVLLLSAKSLLSVACMAIVSISTPFPDLLRALESLHVPRLLTLLLAFVYRYMAVLLEEIENMEKAWTARYFGRKYLRQFRLLGHILASFLIRSFERAERVYAAMQSRGFSGDARVSGILHYGLGDGVFAASLCVGLGWIRWKM